MLRRDLPVILFSAAYMVVFVAISMTRKNYEFILYAAVVVAIAAWILAKQRTVRFDPVILWGLSIWGLLHMAGGNLRVGDSVLYNLQLIPVVLRYDQLVHAFGFGTATLVCHHILAGLLRPDIQGRAGSARHCHAEQSEASLKLLACEGRSRGRVAQVFKLEAINPYYEFGDDSVLKMDWGKA